ncbi:MAG: DUF2167 domain-containing protein [Acetobacteraceae bacterium]|nr:DUF2167 domain-containing protein [Acetobacteraceae bacterium]
MSPSLAQQARPRDQQHDVSVALNHALLTASGGGLHVKLGDQAILTVPEDELFLPSPGADALLRAASRPVPDDYAGIVIDQSAIDWFAILQVVARGHVDADEMTSWTANDLIASVRDDVERDNVQRMARGEPAMEVRRWIQPPTYDAARHQLLWCLLIVPQEARRDAGGEIVYNAVTFGRTGYVRLALATTVDQLPREQDIPGVVLNHIEYLPGQGFGDFQSGKDAMDSAGLAGVFGIERIRKADFKTRVHAFAAPLVVPGGITLIVAMVGGLTVLLYRWRHVRRPMRRG